jgi:hypothetical protein
MFPRSRINHALRLNYKRSPEIEQCLIAEVTAVQRDVTSAETGIESARPLACKSRADCVPQCAPDVPPRKIFGHHVGPSAVVLGSLLHGCYIVGTWTEEPVRGP